MPNGAGRGNVTGQSEESAGDTKGGPQCLLIAAGSQRNSVRIADGALAHHRMRTAVSLPCSPAPSRLQARQTGRASVAMMQPASSPLRAAAAPAAAAAPLLPPLLSSWLPISILTDSYKTTHYLQYPPCSKMVAVRAAQRAGLHAADLAMPCKTRRAADTSSAHLPALAPLPPSTVSCDKGTTRTWRTRGRSSMACAISSNRMSTAAGRCRCASAVLGA